VKLPKACLMCWKPALPGGSRCREHAGKSGWAQRPSIGTSRGIYGYAWQQIRRQVLTEADHVCQCRDPRCDHTGSACPRRANTVDHILNVARGGAAYDRSNLQALCWRCHARKTASEGGRKRSRDA
jgi:5-methylcytosine-specific restriction protein A